MTADDSCDEMEVTSHDSQKTNKVLLRDMLKDVHIVTGKNTQELVVIVVCLYLDNGTAESNRNLQIHRPQQH